MVNIKEKINILEFGKDLPFYNDVPKLSIVDWLIMLAAVILFIGYITFIPLPGEYLAPAYFLTGLIPALYICKGNYGLFFKKIGFKDIKLIIVLLIGMYIYTVIVGLLLKGAMGSVAGHSGFGDTTIMTFVTIIVQIFGEEFFKIFMLLIIMYLVYKFTKNSNIAVSIGLIGAMAIFGLCHYQAYEGRILQILLIQGLGSIFEYFAYIKTKNVLVSYVLHVLRDCIPLLLGLLHLVPGA